MYLLDLKFSRGVGLISGGGYLLGRSGALFRIVNLSILLYLPLTKEEVNAFARVRLSVCLSVC